MATGTHSHDVSADSPTELVDAQQLRDELTIDDRLLDSLGIGLPFGKQHLAPSRGIADRRDREINPGRPVLPEDFHVVVNEGSAGCLANTGAHFFSRSRSG